MRRCIPKVFRISAYCAAVCVQAGVLPAQTPAPGPTTQVEVTPQSPRVGQRFRVRITRTGESGTTPVPLAWPPANALGGMLRLAKEPGGVTVLDGKRMATQVFRGHGFAAGEVPLPDGRTLTVQSALADPPDLGLEWPAEPLPVAEDGPSPLWLLWLLLLGFGVQAFRRRRQAAPTDESTQDHPEAGPAPDRGAAHEAALARVNDLTDRSIPDHTGWQQAHEDLNRAFREGAAAGGTELSGVTPFDLTTRTECAEILAALPQPLQASLPATLRDWDVARFGLDPGATHRTSAHWRERVRTAAGILDELWRATR